MAGFISVSLSKATQAKTFTTGWYSLVSKTNLTSGFVSTGDTAKITGRTLVVAKITQKDGLYTYEANYDPGYLTLTGGTNNAVTFKSDKAYWNSALNVGHSVNLGAGVGDKWTVKLGQYDDTVKIFNAGGNTITTGTAQDGDWVIIDKASAKNTVTFGGNGYLSVAGNNNLITATGTIGSLEHIATLSGNNNTITGANGVMSIAGKLNVVSFTDASAKAGFITLGAASAQDTINVAPTNSTIIAKGGDQHLINVTGVSGFVSIAKGKGDTVSAVSGLISLSTADVKDAVIQGSENTVSVMAAASMKDEGNKDTLIIFNKDAEVEAAGTNGTIKVDGKKTTEMQKVTVSGSGYTFTGGEGNDKVKVTGSSNVINGGDGADQLNITGKFNKVQVGAGGDNVTLGGASNAVTLNSAAGDADVVKVTGNFNTVIAPYISGDTATDVISITGASNLIDGRDVVVGAKLQVKDNGSNNTIMSGTQGADVTIEPTAKNTNFLGGQGSDTLSVEGAQGGSYNLAGGNDSVQITGGTGHKLDLGTGADEVTLRSTYETIYAGTGDDTIVFDGTAAGANTDGFNYVELVEDNNLVSMHGGDGHTTIMGGISADTIHFSGGDVEQDVLNLADGNDFVSLDATSRGNNTSIYGGAGDDSVYAATAEQLMVDGGTGDDSITIVDARYNTIVAGVGDDSITLGGAGTDTSTGYNVVNLGGLEGNKGHNQVSIGGGLTNNIVYGGVEKDVIDLGTSGGRNEVSLTAKNSTVKAAYRDDTITAAKGGVDIIDAVNVAAGEEVVVSNYSIAEKDVLAGVEDISFVNAAGNRELKQDAFVAGNALVFNSDGTIKTDLTGKINANITPTEADAGVQVYVRDTVYGALNTTAVWFATDYGSNINAAKDHVKVAMVMTGANNDAADTIIGGDLADTMYAGTGDTLAGGLGNDSLVNTTAVGQSREEFGIARYTGKDTVQNFDGGFAGTDDAVLFYEGTLLNGTSVTYTTGQMTINNGSGSLVLQLADTNSVDSISAHVLLQDGTNGSAQRLTAITAGSTETVTDATIAKYYYGSKNGGSAIDVSGLTQGVKIDLGNSGRYFEAGENYSYIDAVTGSNGGDNFLAGNGDRSETLTGGNGVFNTLYGGGSANDQLVGGGTGALGVNATDIFYFGQSDGKDVITNIGEGDKVMLYDMVDDGSVTAEVVSLSGGNFLRVTNANTGAQAFIESSQNDETYDVFFTNGINGDVTSHYQVSGTTMKKV